MKILLARNILFVFLRTTNKKKDSNDSKEIFRRTGKDSPLCQSHGASRTHSHTPVSSSSGMLLFGDIHEELPIAKATVSQHLKELKEAELIQGEIEAPKVRYCINKENWEIARRMFADFFGQPVCKKRAAAVKLFFAIDVRCFANY